MEYSSKPRTVTAYLSDINKNRISFDHKVQRRGNQWSKLQKAELIRTLIGASMPIPPIHVSKENNGKLYVIDGKQRLTTINDYVNDGFSLPKEFYIIDDEGKRVNLDKLKFSKLPQEYQERIKETEITLITYTDLDFKESADIYTVLNNGTPLSPAQKLRAKISEDILVAIDDVLESPYFEIVPFTMAQLRKGTDLNLILEAAVLAGGYEITGFGSKDLNNYVQSIKPTDIKKIRTACDEIAKYVKDSTKETRFGGYKKINTPMFFAGMAVSKNKKKYYENFVKFDKDYENNTKYKEFCMVGTSKKENVEGRWNYFKKNIIA